MDYQQSLRLLLSLPDFERQRDRAIIPRRDLSRTLTLLERLGNPHLAVPAVHITGTKGKGSTATMVASALAAQGYRVGLFISPHLHTFRERIQLNGAPVSEERFAGLVEEVWPHRVSDEETESGAVTAMRSLFEVLTGMAFLYYAQERCDLAVLEVGMGGRLDTTNVCRSVVSIITSISLDHMEVLGDTVGQIATEKAGIIRPGVPVVAAPQPPEALAVIRQRGRELAAPLVEVAESYRWRLSEASLEGQRFSVQGPRGGYQLWIRLLGSHQMENAATVVAALEALDAQGYPVSREAIVEGLRKAELPGRLEVLQRQPLVVADGAHNPYSMRCLVETLPHYLSYDRVVVVMGCGGGHSLVEMAAELARLSPRVVATRSRHPAARPTQEVVEAFARHGIEAEEVEGVGVAMEEAIRSAGPGDLVLAVGSLFVAAEAREQVKGVPGEVYPTLSRRR